MLERARASTSSEYALRYCADACCRRNSQMHAVFIVPILVVAALGRATLAWWRLCGSLHTYVYTVQRRQKERIWAKSKSSAGARERNSTSKIRLRRDGGTHHYNFPLSAREHNSKHTLRRRRVRGSRPPRPVPPAARRRNSAFDFRPRRDGATRASVGISNFLLLI